jgi:hypothetical protein
MPLEATPSATATGNFTCQECKLERPLDMWADLACACRICSECLGAKLALQLGALAPGVCPFSSLCLLCCPPGVQRT